MSNSLYYVRHAHPRPHSFLLLLLSCFVLFFSSVSASPTPGTDEIGPLCARL